MTEASVLERGRQAFERQAWAAAYELLRAADQEAALAPEDLERASQAAYLSGHDDDSFPLLERSFRERMRQGDPEGAAMDGFWLVFELMGRGEWARAGGWIGRARATQSRRPSSMAARARPIQPPARAQSPRFISPKTSQNPSRAAPSGSPCRIRSRNERSSSGKESSSCPLR